jgi:hypothetical protein
MGWQHTPTRNELFARSASCSKPRGETNGDFELRAAAIVKAGSKQRNRVEINKNLPRWTSVGSLLKSLPIGVISSVGVKARTCKFRISCHGGSYLENMHASTSIETALWTLMDTGGSMARDNTSSMEVPRLTLIILIRRARSERLSRIISGRGLSAICKA